MCNSCVEITQTHSRWNSTADLIFTAAIRGHQKSVGAGVVILLCQLLSVFLISEGEARHVFKLLNERGKGGWEEGGGEERVDAVTRGFTF